MSLQKLNRDEDIDNLKTAVRELLADFSLDWYVSIMGKSERPEGHSSGIANVIHNKELTHRMAIRIKNLKDAYDSCKE